MATLQVKIGDRIRKSDSGIVYVVERFDPPDLSRAVNGRCRVHFEKSTVSYAGRLLTNGAASLAGFEAVKVRKRKQLPLEAPLPEAAAVSQELGTPKRSWTTGDVLVDGYSDRWTVVKVGLVPGEMREPRFFAELRSCAGMHRGTIRVEYPCVGGVMASSSYVVEPKAVP